MDRRIRVTQVIYSFDVEGTGGGLSRFVIALSQSLKQNEFDVTVCSLWNMGTPSEKKRIEQLNAAGVRAFAATDWDASKPTLSLWKSYQGLRGYLRKHPCEIVHSHSEFSDIVTLMTKFIPGVPFILRTLHNGFQVEWRKRYLRRLLLTNLLYPLVYNGEIGVSKHVVNNMNRRWLSQRLKHKAILIYNAIDTSRFAQIQHEVDKTTLRLGIPSDAYLVGTVGRLCEEKGYSILISAAEKVIQQIHNAYLVIVGAGELKESLQAHAKALHIDEHVIFTGPRSDIEILLSGMDLFVCSSLWEGLSTAVLEAMAAGVPVLATDIPGNRELITPEVNGWLVPAKDVNALAFGILMIYQLSNQERQEVTSNARQAALSYSIDAIAEQHSRYYQQLISGRGIDNS